MATTVLCADILDLKKRIHAGYILVYSPHRQASLAILKLASYVLMQVYVCM